MAQDALVFLSFSQSKVMLVVSDRREVGDWFDVYPNVPLSKYTKERMKSKLNRK